MKKTIAALGASVLGLGSAVVVGGPVAADEPVLPSCADFSEQVGGVVTPDPGSGWFENCVPQYGLGKVEFTIVVDEDDASVEFPEAFEPLSDYVEEDSGITASTSLDQAALAAYFEGLAAPEDIVPVMPFTGITGSESSQTYVAVALAPITSMTEVVAEDVPEDILAACEFDDDAPLLGGVVATYAPIDATFTQTVDGKQWAYTLTGEAPPSYFLFGDSVACVTDGESAVESAGSSEALLMLLTVWPFVPEGTTFGGPPSSLEQLLSSVQSADLQQLLDDAAISPAEIGESGLYTLGVFGPNALPAPPALAATGSDGNALILPAIIVGGVVILGGALVAVSVIRKRRKDDPATPQDTPDTTV